MPALLPVTLALAAGMGLQYAGLGLWWVFVPIALSLVCLLTSRIYMAIVLMALSVGALDLQLQSPRPLPPNLYGHEETWTGEITETRLGETSQSAVVKIDSVNNKPCRKFKIQIVSTSFVPEFNVSYRVTVKGALEPLISHIDFPDDVDYDRVLRGKNLMGKVIVSEDQIISLQPEGGWLHAIYRWREWVEDKIYLSSLNQGTKDFLAVTLVGNREMLTPSTREVFSAAGLSHLLAISGLHVGMIVWIISLMLYPLRFAMMWRTRLILTIAVMWVFIIMVGAGPAVVRSGVMATIFLVARLIERDASPLNSLCVSAFLILAIDPFSLFTPGFQLTFIAVFAILIISPKLIVVSPKRRHLHRIVTLVAVPVAALLGTGVFAAYYFHVFPCYFLLANVVSALVLPFLLLGGVLVCLCEATGIGYGAVAWCTDGCYSIIINLSQWVASLPGATQSNIYLSWQSAGVLLAAVVAFSIWLYRRRWQYLAVAGMMAVMAIIMVSNDNDSYPYYEHHLLYEHNYTGLLVKNGSQAWYFTTNPLVERLGNLEDANKRCSEFLGRRHLGPLKFIANGLAVPGISRTENVVSVQGKRYAFITRENQARYYGCKIDYAVIANGYKGNIVQAVKAIKPDTVVLGRDLNLLRHNKYLIQLDASEIPFKSMRGVYKVSKAPAESNCR